MQGTNTTAAARLETPELWDFEALARRLAALPAGTRYVNFQGNAGDALIADGTRQFFAAHGLSFTEHDIEVPLEDGAAVVMGGGGNFIPLYDHVARFLADGVERLGPMVLLPSTVRGNEALLARLPAQCLILCRDLESYTHCRAHLGAAELALCPDMAFAWEAGAHDAAFSEMLPRALMQPYSWRFAAKSARAFWQARQVRRAGGRLSAFRTDAEATGRRLPDGNRDLSELFRPRDVGPLTAPLAVQALCRFIAPFDEVETNRLHIAVLAAHLGKRVFASDNNYGKLAAVLALAPEALRARISFV
ncbi:MAG: polysaccharide pyruvyl transferase family protein [Pseudomonadota bacterium]